MEIISQTIKYSRKELNKIIKELKGNLDLVFDAEKLAKNEQKLIEYYHKTANLNYLMYEEFPIIINLFKKKIIYMKDKQRFIMKSKDALELINNVIDDFALYDFWIINDDKIICLDHEHEICIINKKNLR